ncbi:MAG TPA: CHAT domain-containing tetratricopeptide repeat protein [Kofleriaceae bacterium]|nr:CHAT domain-containing tetratricopeptide repeat protein [Kofleriaceae bacterium]
MVGAGRLRYRLVLAALGALAVVAASAPAAAQKRRPRPRQRPPAAAPADEIARLEKQLLDRQVRGAMIPSLRLARRIYQLKVKKLGPDHPDTGRALAQVAQLTAATGDYSGALAIHRDIVARAEKRHGKADPAILPALEGLAGQLWMAQRFDEADTLYQRVLALRRAQSGPDSAPYAAGLQTYAALLTGRHAYDAAEEKYLEAKAILDRTGKPDDPSQSGLLMSLGLLYWSEGQQARAAHQFDRAIAILDKFYAETIVDPSQVAGLVLAVASIYATGGRADLARPLEERGERLYRQAVADIEGKYGASDLRLIAPLSSLAQLHQRRRQWDDAERLIRRVMAIQAAQKGPGVSPLSSITWMFSLAYLERQRGRPRAALPMLEKVRGVYRSLYGDYMASTMDHQIADVWRELGDYRRARRILERVLVTSRRTWGPRHPLVATQLSSLAMLHMAEGRARPAVARMREALDIEEPQLALVLATGTESDHATFFSQTAYQLHMAITLHARYAPRDRDAARLAMTTVLRRKGRILDAAAASVATLRGKLGPDDRKVLDELAAARGRLAALIVAGPGATDTPEQYSVEVGRLEREVKRLEDLARRRSAAYRVQSQPIELDAVQKAIPADGVLVEIVAYQPYDARAVGPWDPNRQPPRRYGAYLLRRTGDPSWVELGDAKAIDAAADGFLAALADPDRSDVDALGRALFDRAFKGLVAQLGQTRRVLIAPDGLLNLVPFGAMVEPSGRHLIQRFTFSYLTSGRDLLRLGTGARAKRGPVIVADPRFDSADPAPGASGAGAAPAAKAPAGNGPAGNGPAAKARSGQVVASRGLRSRALRGKKWAQLPGTGEEADALASLLGQVEVLRGTHATEAALKKVAGPRILHIATHGFFLPAEAPRPAEPASAAAGAAPPAIAMPLPVSPAAGPAQADPMAPENPLLRSGLVLAGANRLSSGGEDGILTALEAAGLDLWGTQMVVLSACETGVGKVTEGDGVHGLRRALVIAGAESLVMSLWQVDDRATRELMAGFYRRLEQGEGRSEALRQVQLQMLRRPRTSHPYYWASFVPTGSWAPLAPVEE